MRISVFLLSFLLFLALHGFALGQTDSVSIDSVDSTFVQPTDTLNTSSAGSESLIITTLPIHQELLKVGSTTEKNIDTTAKVVADTIPLHEPKHRPAVDRIQKVKEAEGAVAKKLITLSDSASKLIDLTPQMASKLIQRAVNTEKLWKNHNDSLRTSLTRLLWHYNEPYNAIAHQITSFNWDTLSFEESRMVEMDTLPLRWLDKTVFIVDTIPLERNPVLEKRTVMLKSIDPMSLAILDLKHDLKQRVESILEESVDTIRETIIDRAYLKSKKIQPYQITEKGITPPLKYKKGFKPYRFNTDSTLLVMKRSQPAIAGGPNVPFGYFTSIDELDSLKVAIKTLNAYTTNRDSVLININDKQGRKIPLWLTSGKEDMFRYWIKNSNNDSITIWIGNPAKNDILLTLEENVTVERLEPRLVNDVPFTRIKPQTQLTKLNPLREIPIHWNFGIVGSYALNENFFSNYWAQGGESSLNSLLDINALSEYNNNEIKLKWTTTGRVRYGTSWTKENAFRTSTDIMEINSQSNKVLKEKIDFSAILYLKTQVAKGFNYPNDSVVISKFLNPGAITIGLGFEFKPYPKTSINFSPLSYRNTFVFDTLTIDQTSHGIDAGKRTNQELGGQLLVKNSLTMLKDMEIKNTLRLFSSYLHKPQNMDVDWEMSIEKQVSIYFKIKLNLHLIYNDRILFPLVDGNNEPIMLPNGLQKKGPRVQFNQMLGLTIELRI